jgi:hypothetical protein
MCSAGCHPLSDRACRPTRAAPNRKADVQRDAVSLAGLSSGYPSVQLGSSDGGLNVVPFPRASLVEGASSTFKAEVELWEYEDDGSGRWLSPVIEWPDPRPAGQDHRASGNGRNAAARPPALGIDRESIRVHQVQRVSVTTKSHSVKVKPSDRSAGGR